MFNLLPKIEKETIRREYRTRLAVVALSLFCVVTVISSVLLIPSFILSAGKEKVAEQRVDALTKNVERGNSTGLESSLQKAKSRLALLRHTDPKILQHELLIEIVSVKSNQISLKDISFSGSAGGKRTMSIAGIAQNREALLAFVKALERTNLFATVKYPVANLSKNANIEFSVTATGTF